LLHTRAGGFWRAIDWQENEEISADESDVALLHLSAKTRATS
jgi:hypothetical protein